MASSDNLVTVEQQPWRFGPGGADGWMSDFFTRETETLTRALTRSLTSPSPTDCTSSELVESVLMKPETTPSASGGSEIEVPFSKRRTVGATGRITKRKSRASKRATTTFITADPANFRQMVQEVTGLRFDGDVSGLASVAPVWKPDPQRQVSMFQTGCALPTLDTSSFLLEQQLAQPPVINVPPLQTMGADGGAGGFSFDSFCSFPTLESWKVM